MAFNFEDCVIETSPIKFFNGEVDKIELNDNLRKEYFKVVDKNDKMPQAYV